MIIRKSRLLVSGFGVLCALFLAGGVQAFAAEEASEDFNTASIEQNAGIENAGAASVPIASQAIDVAVYRGNYTEGYVPGALPGQPGGGLLLVDPQGNNLPNPIQLASDYTIESKTQEADFDKDSSLGIEELKGSLNITVQVFGSTEYSPYQAVVEVSDTDNDGINDRIVFNQILRTNSLAFVSAEKVSTDHPGYNWNAIPVFDSEGNPAYDLTSGLESGFTVSGQVGQPTVWGEDGFSFESVANRSPQGLYAWGVKAVVSDTNGNGINDHVEIVGCMYPDETYTPQIVNEKGQAVPVNAVRGGYYQPIQSSPIGDASEKWDVEFGGIWRGPIDGAPYNFAKEVGGGVLAKLQKAGISIGENGALVIPSDAEGNLPTSVDLEMSYDPRIDAYVSIVAYPRYGKKEAITVNGSAAVSVSGSIGGWNVPAGADVAVNAEAITSGAEYDELMAKLAGGSFAGVFRIDLMVNGQQVHDGFGSLTVTFPVDAKYNGHWVTVWHRHNDGSITSERVMAENGAVTVTVTDLSSFALEIGELAVSEGEGGEGEKAESSSDATPLAKTGDPLSWAGLAGLALAALAACGAAALSSRKVR